MPHVVKVPGAAADRFRAYARVNLTRKPTVDEQIRRVRSGKPPFKKGEKIAYQGEDVALAGDVTGRAFSFDSGDVEITRVALYRGPVESEAVVGVVDVDQSGLIEIELVEPDGE